QRDVRIRLIGSNAHDGARFLYGAMDIVRLQQRIGQIDTRIYKRGLHAKRGLKLRDGGWRIALRKHDQTESIGGFGIARIFANRFGESDARGGKVASLQSRGSLGKRLAILWRISGRTS